MDRRAFVAGAITAAVAPPLPVAEAPMIIGCDFGIDEGTVFAMCNQGIIRWVTASPGRGSNGFLCVSGEDGESRRSVKPSPFGA